MTFHRIQFIVTYISDYRRGLDWWIDLLTQQVVTTNNYNIIADFHTTDQSTLKSSQSTFTSLYLVRAVHNGICSVFTGRFLVTNQWRFSASVARWLTLHSWTLNCTSLTRSNRTLSVESYILGVEPQRTPPAAPLLLLCDVTAHVHIQSLHSNAVTVTNKWHIQFYQNKYFSDYLIGKIRHDYHPTFYAMPINMASVRTLRKERD
jgi:hypothetical protein